MRVGLSAADALRAVRGTNYTVHTVTNGGTGACIYYFSE